MERPNHALMEGNKKSTFSWFQVFSKWIGEAFSKASGLFPKLLILLLFVTLPVVVSFADHAHALEFIRHQVKDTFFNDPASVYYADMDGDGDFDILGAAEESDDITWWENRINVALGWVQHPVANNFDGASAVYASDIDGDGDMDILGAAREDDDIAWWENTDGTGKVWAKHTVDDDFYEVYAVYASDMDGDGDADILAGAYSEDLTWWENTDGKGGGWIEHIVDGGHDEVRSIYTCDMDKDGDMDILTGSEWSDYGIEWWENTGAAWVKHTVDGYTYDAYSVYASDMDGDLDLDILGALDSDGIKWWENTESGWVEHTVDDGFDSAYSVFAVDFDKDGHMDILGASDDYGLAWWENDDGVGGSWVEHTVDNQFEDAISAVAVDFDSDGNADILGASDYSDDISWWDNTDGLGGGWTKNRITIVDNYGAESVHASDINGDGKTDIVGAGSSAESITWWENSGGAGDNLIEHTVDESFSGARSVFSTDMNGDGYTDILGGSYSGLIAWWKNTDGAGTNWQKQEVDTSFDASSVYASDINGDGYKDAISASRNSNDIAWWKNTDGTGTVWEKHDVTLYFSMVTSVFAADINEDGKTDILGAASGANDISWWENIDGTGTIWVEHTVDGDFAGAQSVFAADINGDGHMDIIGGGSGGGDFEIVTCLKWWENQDGSGTSWTSHAVDDNTRSVQSVRAADMDGDGDLDIAGFGSSDGVSWWENMNGDGTSWTTHAASSQFSYAQCVHVSDINGDGDADIMAASDNDGIAWWEMLPKLTVVLPDNATEGDGVLTAQVTVSLKDAPSSDVSIQLVSNDESELTVPTSVTLGSGDLSVTFDLTILNDALLDGTRTVEVTASADGYSSGTDSMDIYDDETATLTVNVPEIALEGGGTLAGQGTVTVSAAVGKDVTIALSSDDSSVVTVPDTVTVLSGQTSAAFDLTVMDDLYYDGDQTVTITATVTGWTSGSDTITIEDDETVFDLSLTVPAEADEWNGTLVGAGTISIQGYPISDLNIALISDDTSEVTVPSSVSIPAGQMSATFDLTIVQDVVIDGDQTATITASSPGWTSDSRSLTVHDGDPGVFCFSSETYQAGESDGFAAITVNRLHSGLGQITVDFSTSDDTATEGTDYTGLSTTLTFNDQEMSKTIQVPLLEDSELEGNETVALTLSNPGGGSSLENPSEAVLTILDNDYPAPPYAENFDSGMPYQEWEYYSSTSYGRIEAMGYLRMDITTGIHFNLNEAILHVDLSGLENVVLGLYQMNINDYPHMLPSQFSGHYNGDGVAISNDGVTWYTLLGGVDLNSSQYYDINLDDQVNAIRTNYDPSFEYTSDFRIKFQQVGNLPNPSDGRAWDNISIGFAELVTIVPAPALANQSATLYFNASQGNGALENYGDSIYVHTGVNTDQGNWRYVIADWSVNLQKARLTRLSGNYYKLEFQPSIREFYGVPQDETIQQLAMVFRNSDGSLVARESDDGNIFVDISDPKLTLSVPETAAENDDFLSGVGTVGLTQSIGSDLTVSLVSSDTATATVPSTVTIPGGQTSINFDITIIDDSVIDGDKTVTITAQADGWNSPEDTIQVTDNEPPPTVEFAVSQTNEDEDADPAEVNVSVTLSSMSELVVTVEYTFQDGTATGGGVDYTVTGSVLTFNPGVVSQNIIVTLVDDDLDENGDEDFTITLSNPSNAVLGAKDTHTFTILDDDRIPVTITVCASGCDVNSIQAGINAALTYDTVSVEPGTYYENIDFNGKAITVTSTEGPNETFIDGGCNGSVVTFASGETSDSILERFTIRNGCADYGAGIYLDNASPDISYCAISNNAANASGGGVYMTNNASPNMYKCLVNDNHAETSGAGVFCGLGSSPRITSGSINTNTSQSDGGGVCFDGASPTLNDLTINGNSAMQNGGGVIAVNGGNPVLNRSAINGNSAFNLGGGLYISGDTEPQLTNCIVAGNSSQYNGGGFYVLDSTDSVYLYNVTVSDNAAIYGGGLFSNNSSVFIHNSIFWNNGREIDEENSTVTVSYSDMEMLSGVFPGEGNINADPLFKTVGSDYHLQTGSPCIDTGSNTNAPNDDIDRQIRPFNVIRDMGADEWRNTEPTASFYGSPMSGYAPLAVSFTDTSDSAQEIISWDWDFGDGNTSTEQHPDHQYESPGSYTVKLIVEDEDGDVAESEQPAYITPYLIQSNFSASPIHGYSPLDVTFTDLSDAAGTISSWLWNFGDGATSTEQHPTHQYTTPGQEYTVSLTVEDANGNHSTKSRPDYIIVYDDVPTTNFHANPRDGYAPLSVSFFDDSVSPDPIAAWLWNFGDGNTSEEQHPTHLYTGIGQFNVTLTVTDNNGDSNTQKFYYYITVNEQLINADFYAIPTNGGSPLQTRFYNTSTSYYTISGWQWDFGDGATSTEESPFHTYTDIGSYTVTLTMTTQGGEDDEIKDDYINVLAGVRTLSVCAGGGCDYETIQAAIDGSANGDTILVSSGTYNENISFTGKAVTVKSQTGKTDTIIDGQCQDSVVRFVNGEGVGSVLSGFTIQNGCAEYGGGIYCNGSSSPVIENCDIKNNHADYGGGGAAALYSSNPKIQDCAVTQNTAENGAGVACYYSSSPDIMDVAISGNTAGEDGGGLYTYFSSSAALQNCTIESNAAANRGGGIYASLSTINLQDSDIKGNQAENGAGIFLNEMSSPLLQRCEISNNTVTGGGGGGGMFALETSLPEFRNCLIVNNSAMDGGAMYFENTTAPVLVNCTAAENNAGNQGAGIYGEQISQALTVVNSILFNGGDEIYLMDSETEVVEYSDVERTTGVYPGTGNINEDPQFINPASNYHLGLCSPARNSGTAADAPPDDMDRKARPSGTGFDMGVYEEDDVTLTVAIPESAVENDGVLSGQGLVEISVAQGNNLTVTLESDDTSEVTVPASVTILSGQTSATFNLTIVDDEAIDEQQTVTITASIEDCLTATDTIAVSDNENYNLSVALPESYTEGDGNQVDAGTVSITGTLESDLEITLVSNDTTEATVPGTVTIVAGETSVSFDVNIQNDSDIDGTQTVTITASAVSWTSGNDSMDVNDNETVEFTVELPASATEGDGNLADAGSVGISGTLETDLDISLDSNDTSEVTVPATVTIVAGQISVLFEVNIQEDTEIDGTQTATVTASADGWTSGNDTMDINDNEPRDLAIQIPETATEGDGTLSNSGTVSIQGTYGSDLVLNLVSGDTTEATVPATVTITQGQDSAMFDVTVVDDGAIDGSQTITITVSAEGWTSGNDTMQVHDNETLTLTIQVPETTAEGDGNLEDAGNVSIPGTYHSDLAVTLASDDITEAVVPSSVTIKQGQTFATFDLTIADDMEIDGTQTATITASADGWTSGTGTVNVNDNETKNLSIQVPETATEGDGVLTEAGSVSIVGTLDSDLEVTLSSDDTTEVTVPVQVTIPSGQTSAKFDLTIVQDAESDSPQTATITASATGWTSGNDNITVQNNSPTAVTGQSDDIQTTRVDLSGTVNPNGADTSWHFEYWTAPENKQSSPGLSLSASGDDTPVSETIYGLDVDTSYEYRLAAFDIRGTAYGETMSFTTDEIVIDDEYYLDPDGICGDNTPCFSTLQSVIDNTPEDNIVILVAEGLYHENVTIPDGVTLVLTYKSNFADLLGCVIIAGPRN